MPKILVIAPSWLGDMVMTQSLLKTLTTLYNKVLIYVAASPHLLPLLKRMPEVYQTIILDLPHGELGLAKRYQIGLELRKYHFKQAIIIPNSFKAALIPFFAKIPRRTGFVKELRGFLLNDKKYYANHHPELFITKLSKLLLPHASTIPQHSLLPTLTSSPSQQQTTLKKFHLKKTKQPILALCPGAAFGPAKRWPAVYYATVAQAQIAAGWQIWLFGSNNDQDTTNEIMRLTNNNCVNLSGTTQLDEVIDLLAQVNIVITNDSGLMHIAAALDKHVLAIYGATNPQITPPLCNKAKIFYLQLPCQPCGKRHCPLHHLNCLHKLKPQTIIDYLALLPIP